MVTGGSYGGYMTLAVATHYNDRIRCSLDVVGISNFVTFLENTEAYRRDLRRVEYGDERDPAMREFLLRISPVNNAAEDHAGRCSWCRGATTRACRTPSPSRWSRPSAETAVPSGTCSRQTRATASRKKKNQDFQFYATVAFVREYLLK